MDTKLIMYMHAGSGNHGCEAIVNSVLHMTKAPVLLVSYFAQEDCKYSLNGMCEILQEKSFGNHKIAHIIYYLYRKLTKDHESFIRFRYRNIFRTQKSPLAISIGGDNYCYDNMLNDLKLANNAFQQAGTKTILLGCSIEPELLKREEIQKDLLQYHMIIARESITYQGLKEMIERAKVSKAHMPILHCYPDPAFTLPMEQLPLPKGFAEGNTVGINISPMIQENETQTGITMEGYQELIGYILKHTDMQVALIPHVIWERSDDRKPMQELYEKYHNSGRVLRIPDGTCEELKGYISRCRFFVGARTHATIAAYSTGIPTLVVGYSVKARGIAKDLFGTDEQYVIPVQSLKTPKDLAKGFQWLMEKEEEIQLRLQERMPAYQEEALRTGKEVDKLWEELNQQRGISRSVT